MGRIASMVTSTQRKESPLHVEREPSLAAQHSSAQTASRGEVKGPLIQRHVAPLDSRGDRLRLAERERRGQVPVDAPPGERLFVF